MIRGEPLKALVQPLCHCSRVPWAQLCGEEYFLPGIGVSGEKPAIALFTQAVTIALGSVPEIHTPSQGLPEKQLIIDSVEHPSKRQDRHFYASLAQLAPGSCTFPGAGLFRSSGAHSRIQ